MGWWEYIPLIIQSISGGKKSFWEAIKYDGFDKSSAVAAYATLHDGFIDQIAQYNSLTLKYDGYDESSVVI